MCIRASLVALTVTFLFGLGGVGCVLDNQSSADAAVYDVADAAPYPGFRDASSCSGGTSGSSGTGGCVGDGGRRPTKPADAAAPDATACDYVTFSYDNAIATSVWVSGDFTSWADSPANGAKQMAKSASTWSWSGPIGSGRHIYKFIVDGSTWISDPSNGDSESDGLGGVNSVISVCTN